MHGINRPTLERYLAEAEKHVLRGECHIQAHRRHIAVLEQHGRDCTQARKVLTTSEELLVMYVARRDQLREDVSMAETPAGRSAG